VRCFGDNREGQLGAGPRARRRGPVDVPGIGDAVEVVAGETFSCARLTGGGVRCWGSNRRGQLGDDSRAIERAKPAPVRGLSDAVQLAAGARHVCARRVGGEVVCWGDDTSGELGQGSRPARPVSLPAGCSRMGRQVCCSAPPGSRFSVFCRPYKTYVDRHDGAFFRRAHSRVPVPVAGLSDAAFIAAGDSFSCALRRGGQLRCWGENGHRQLRDDATAQLRAPIVIPGLSPASAIAARASTLCARRRAGAIVCQGIERPDAASCARLRGVAGPLALQPGRICVLRRRGGLACAGAGLAFGVTARDLDDVVEAASGHFHACVRKRGGTVLCWGNNESGQLGGGTRRQRGRVTLLGL